MTNNDKRVFKNEINNDIIIIMERIKWRKEKEGDLLRKNKHIA